MLDYLKENEEAENIFEKNTDFVRRNKSCVACVFYSEKQMKCKNDKTIAALVDISSKSISREKLKKFNPSKNNVCKFFNWDFYKRDH